MKRPKILLVDKEGTARDGLQEVLENYDFEVIALASVTEAIDAIVNQRFDIFITDLDVPNFDDGLAVMAAMHRSQPWAMTVALRTVRDAQEPLATVVQQADKVLEKPIAVRELVRLI
jgi:DNA-binding NtrC family response regulator